MEELIALMINGLFGGVVGIGNTPIGCESKDILFAILESFQEATYLSFLQPPSFSRLPFRQWICCQTFCNDLVIPPHVPLQFFIREGRTVFHHQQVFCMAHPLQ